MPKASTPSSAWPSTPASCRCNEADRLEICFGSGMGQRPFWSRVERPAFKPASFEEISTGRTARMEIETFIGRKHVTLRIRGRFTRADGVQLKKTIVRLLEEGHRHFVVSLG